MFRSLIAIVVAALSLTGCAGLRLVDTDVRSYASAPLVPAGARYRFERLPSQQANSAQQSRLETLTQQALARVGLQRHDAAATHSVLVSAGLRVDPYAPWDLPYNGWSPSWNLGWGIGGGRGGASFLLGFGGRGALPYYSRELSLVMRHLGTGQVVFETHAAHAGRWADNEAVWPAMVEAALSGFPNPPPGVRRVNIEIPR